MDAVDGLSQELTIIMIAHRLSTIENCDVLFELVKESDFGGHSC